MLGGARETVLFCYGALTRPDGARNLEALRPHIPSLLEAARQARRRQIVGVAAYKPANSHAEKETFVYDFVGMLGVPLVPCHEFPVKAQAAFFPVHVLKDPQFVDKFERFLRAGKQALITDGLAEQIKDRVRLERPTVHILPVNGKPEALTELPEEQVEAFRKPLLEALKVRFRAPNQVALYLFRDGSWAIENFLDRAVEADYQGRLVKIAARDWALNWR